MTLRSVNVRPRFLRRAGLTSDFFLPSSFTSLHFTTSHLFLRHSGLVLHPTYSWHHMLMSTNS